MDFIKILKSGGRAGIVIKNTFAPHDAGTLIDSTPAKENGEIVKGISHIDNVALVNLEGSGMVGITGFSKRFFEALSDENINVIMITQASSEHSICIGVKEVDANTAKKVIDEKFAFEISINKVSPAKIERNMVIHQVWIRPNKFTITKKKIETDMLFFEFLKTKRLSNKKATNIPVQYANTIDVENE